MERLALDQCEAVLVHNPSNMFYLSGYTGEGLVLIGREMQAIITDFRYTEQAESAGSWLLGGDDRKGRISRSDRRRACAREHEIGALYYEDDYLTVRSFDVLPQGRAAAWNGRACVKKCSSIRQIKDEDELSRIAEACRITSEAFERCCLRSKRA